MSLNVDSKLIIISKKLPGTLGKRGNNVIPAANDMRKAF